MIRIAHISDLHIASEPNRVNRIFDGSSEYIYKDSKKSLLKPTSYKPRSLARILEYINKEKFNYILLTGDIATTGQRQDLNISYDMLTGKQQIKDSIFGITFKEHNKLLLLPGNHDRYKKLFRPAGKNFNQIYKSYWKNDEVNTKIIIDAHGNKIALIQIDFSLADNSKNPKQWLGNGKVYKTTLKKIRDVVIEIKKEYENIEILCATHFAPSCSDSSLALINEEKFIKLLNKYDIKHIFCGHTHEEKIYKENDINIYCAGSASSCADNNSFLIHTIEFKKDNFSISTKIKYLNVIL